MVTYLGYGNMLIYLKSTTGVPFLKSMMVYKDADR